jgi:hypothetical protein
VIKKALVIFILKLRWAYFHINPNYIKFHMGRGSNQAHFQHVKDGSIHSNIIWVDRRVK